jgi:hypothetical protein
MYKIKYLSSPIPFKKYKFNFITHSNTCFHYNLNHQIITLDHTCNRHFLIYSNLVLTGLLKLLFLLLLSIFLIILILLIFLILLILLVFLILLIIL